MGCVPPIIIHSWTAHLLSTRRHPLPLQASMELFQKTQGPLLAFASAPQSGKSARASAVWRARLTKGSALRRCNVAYGSRRAPFYPPSEAGIGTRMLMGLVAFCTAMTGDARDANAVRDSVRLAQERSSSRVAVEGTTEP